MPVCEVCGEEKRRGYRINPRTGRCEPKRFWCSEDYERIVARTARGATVAETIGRARRGRGVEDQQ